MKHWRPDTEAIPLHQDERRRRRDWTSLDGYAPPGPLPRTLPLTRARAHDRRAAMAGLALVAAMCLAIAIGAHALLAPPKPVDRAALTG